jgi:hypothetical protein
MVTWEKVDDNATAKLLHEKSVEANHTSLETNLTKASR